MATITPVRTPSSTNVYPVEAAVSTRNDFAGISLPQNPWMGPNNFGSPHCDSYCSESVSLDGPTSTSVKVIRQKNPHGYTPCMVCNSQNQMIGVSLDQNDGHFWLVVCDKNCNILSSTKLAIKQPGTFGGGYFYMNHLEQTVVVSANTMICFDTAYITSTSGSGDENSLTPLWTSDNVIEGITGKRFGNSMYSSLPVWGDDPELYWCLIAGKFDLSTQEYSSPAGMAVVRVTPEPSAPNGCITTIEDSVLLDGEWNNNTFAVDEAGCYFVTNVLDDQGKTTLGYLRGMEFSGGKISSLFASSYENCGYLKVGQKNIGSGTTPTLINTTNGKRLAAITDNAAPQLNVVVYDRENGDKISETPVFAPMRSCDEASLIGVENTLVVENNYNHIPTYPLSQTTMIEPGMARIDLNLDPNGSPEASVTWEEGRISFLAMNMLARESGIIFAHTGDWSGDLSATEGAMYYISALDAFTGRTIWRVPLGRGVAFCHDYGGLYFNHEGSLYIGTQEYICSVQNA